MGNDSIPILERILNGNAVNKFGVPYNRLGMPVLCSLLVIQRLGTLAKPLESYVVEQVKLNTGYSHEALHSIRGKKD